LLNYKARLLGNHCQIVAGHSLLSSCGGPPAPVALWLFLAIMVIKLAEQVFFCPYRITRVSIWSKKLALALGAGCHRRDLALIPQDREVALSHDADTDSRIIYCEDSGICSILTTLKINKKPRKSTGALTLTHCLSLNTQEARRFSPSGFS